MAYEYACVSRCTRTTDIEKEPVALENVLFMVSLIFDSMFYTLNMCVCVCAPRKKNRNKSIDKHGDRRARANRCNVYIIHNVNTLYYIERDATSTIFIRIE